MITDTPTADAGLCIPKNSASELKKDDPAAAFAAPVPKLMSNPLTIAALTRACKMRIRLDLQSRDMFRLDTYFPPYYQSKIDKCNVRTVITLTCGTLPLTYNAIP